MIAFYYDRFIANKEINKLNKLLNELTNKQDKEQLEYQIYMCKLIPYKDYKRMVKVL